MSKFNKNIKSLRKIEGLTQNDVALAIGVTPTAVSYWESAKSEPSYDTLIKLAELFDVTTDTILGADNTNITNDAKKIAVNIKKAVSILKEVCPDIVLW